MFDRALSSPGTACRAFGGRCTSGCESSATMTFLLFVVRSKPLGWRQRSGRCRDGKPDEDQKFARRLPGAFGIQPIGPRGLCRLRGAAAGSGALWRLAGGMARLGAGAGYQRWRGRGCLGGRGASGLAFPVRSTPAHPDLAAQELVSWPTRRDALCRHPGCRGVVATRSRFRISPRAPLAVFADPRNPRRTLPAHPDFECQQGRVCGACRSGPCGVGSAARRSTEGRWLVRRSGGGKAIVRGPEAGGHRAAARAAGAGVGGSEGAGGADRQGGRTSSMP